jgi:hypothetical protein
MSQPPDPTLTIPRKTGVNQAVCLLTSFDLHTRLLNICYYQQPHYLRKRRIFSVYCHLRCLSYEYFKRPSSKCSQEICKTRLMAALDEAVSQPGFCQTKVEFSLGAGRGSQNEIAASDINKATRLGSTGSHRVLQRRDDGHNPL